MLDAILLHLLQFYVAHEQRTRKRGEKVTTTTVAFLVSLITSVCISNIVGIHYLRKLDRDWEDVFVRMKNITLEEISKRNH